MVCLETVLKMSLQEVLKMSWRHLEDVLKTSWRRLEDALKRSWRRFEDILKTSRRHMSKTNILVLTKTPWRRLEDVFWRRKAKANIFVLIKTSSEDEDKRRLQDVFINGISKVFQNCLNVLMAQQFQFRFYQLYLHHNHHHQHQGYKYFL